MQLPLHRVPVAAMGLAAALAAFMPLAGCSDDSPSPSPGDTDADGLQDDAPDLDLQPTDADAGSDTTDDLAPPDQPIDVDRESDDGEGDIIRPDIPIQDGSDAGDGPIEETMQIRAISPERGPVAGGTEILIVGLGFTVDTDIFMGAAMCQNIDFVDETKIICDTPANPAGTYNLKAISAEYQTTMEAAFSYFAPVEVSLIEPGRGPTTGGMPALVSGSGFTSATQVSIGGRVAIAIEVIDDSSIRLITPPGSAGPQRLQVSNENGLMSLPQGFEYYEPIGVTRVLPGAGPAAGGTTVHIVGRGFTDADDLTVVFGMLAADVEVLGPQDLRVVTPQGPSDQLVDVTVMSARNGEYVLADGFYYYGQAEGPAVYHVSPDRGSTSGGTLVYLSGLGLQPVTDVTIAGVAATLQDTSNPEDGYRIVRTPPGSPGPADVVVSTASQSTTLEDGFTYVAGVDVSSITPDEGDIAGGTPVTLAGSGFTAGTAVRIGALSASGVEVVDSGTLTALTPPGAVGPADVVVRSPSGLEDILPKGFFYTSEGAIFGFSPGRGSIAGGTYTVVRGAGFFEPLEVFFGGVEATQATLLDSATLEVWTPPHEEGYVYLDIVLGDGQVLNSPDRFLYYDPLSISGGVWGDEILGAVNVTVLSDNGTPLGGAFVMLNIRQDSAYTGTTDMNGQVTLSGPDLSGAQTVTATRLGFSSSTVQSVDAENVTVVLSCVPEGQCYSNSDCRSGFICMCGPPYGYVGTCVVEPYCGFEITSQEQFDEVCSMSFDPVPYGIITGNLTGVHKVDDPGPNERIVGAVFTTQPHPFRGSSVDPGAGNTMEDDGPYTLKSRVGEIALVALCGLYDDAVGLFSPRFMGVERGLFIADGQSYTVDIDCDIELNQTITVKSLNAPFAPEGPDRYIHRPYLHFGSEGYFGGVVTIEGTDDVLSAGRFAPLQGQLAGLDYYIKGGAFTGSSWPYSYAVLPDVADVDDILVLPPFLPVPVLTVPGDGGVLSGRYFEWEMSTAVQPDFYYVMIYDFYQTIYWDVVVPGTQNWINLPDWPDTAQVGLLPSGTLLFQIYAIDAVNFDYNRFTFNDLSITSWDAYSLNVFLFNVP